MTASVRVTVRVRVRIKVKVRVGFGLRLGSVGVRVRGGSRVTVRVRTSLVDDKLGMAGGALWVLDRQPAIRDRFRVRGCSTDNLRSRCDRDWACRGVGQLYEYKH